MPQTFKLLGRSSPSATVNTTVYTAPASTTTIVSNLVACNTNTTGVADSVRIFVVPNLSVAAVSNAVVYGISVPNGNPFEMGVAIILNTGDFLVVYSTNGTTTFTLSGLEITSAPSGAPTHKNFGRANPAADADSTLYTAPASTTSLLTSLLACNTDSAKNDSITVFIVPNAGAAATTNAIIFNLVIPPGQVFFMNIGVVLLTGDFLVVESAQGLVTFTASGIEGV